MNDVILPIEVTDDLKCDDADCPILLLIFDIASRSEHNAAFDWFIYIHQLESLMQRLRATVGRLKCLI